MKLFLEVMILHLLAGTYGEKIYSLAIDSVTFETLKCDTAVLDNASYLALGNEGQWLFALSESGPDSKLTSYELLENGSLRQISQIKGIAPDPCFLLWKDLHILTADYSGAGISVYPVNFNGEVQHASQRIRFEGHGPNPERQPFAHIHQLRILGSKLYASDLGADRIHILALKPEGRGGLRLEPLRNIATEPGSGPRHMEISADGKNLYLLTELDNSIYVYDITDGGDNLALRQKLHIGYGDFPVQAGGDIHLSQDGRWLYASLRNGGDCIVKCKVLADGTIEYVNRTLTADHPRNFTIFPDGSTMAVFCKNSRCVQIFEIKSENGDLQDTGKKITIPSDTDSPVFGIFTFK